MQLNEHQTNLVKLLVRHKVVFLVIGGHAVLEYSNYRTTSDLDILLSRSRNNATKLEQALSRYRVHAPDGRKWVDFLTSKGIKLNYPDETNHEADLLTSIDGIDFGKCYQRSIEVELGDVSLRIPSVSDLIAMKIKSIETGNDIAAKQKDAMDISELQTLL